MREAMRGLVQGIVASHEARAAGLASLRRDLSAERQRAQRRLQELRETRLETARGLRAHLARIRHQQAQNQAHLNRVVRRALAAIASSRQAAQASTQASLKGIASRRRAMAGRLRGDLARGLAELQKARTQRRAATRAGLQEAASHRRRIAQEQRRNLFREIRGFLRQAGAQRRPAVEVWLSELTSDRLAAGLEWRRMIAALRERKAGVKARGAPGPTPPREKAVEEVSAVAKAVKAPKQGTRSRGGRRRNGRVQRAAR